MLQCTNNHYSFIFKTCFSTLYSLLFSPTKKCRFSISIKCQNEINFPNQMLTIDIYHRCHQNYITYTASSKLENDFYYLHLKKTNISGDF